MADWLSTSGQHGMEEMPSDERLAEALIYVACSFERRGESWRGTEKLNTVLWWADFESFRERGRSVTGTVYRKQAEGPVPERLRSVRDELVQSGAVTVKERETGTPQPEQAVIAHRDHRPIFDAGDVHYLDMALEQFRGSTATQCSDFSHRESFGWNAVDDNEVIPYGTALVDPRPLTEEHRVWAHAGLKKALEAGTPT